MKFNQYNDVFAICKLVNFDVLFYFHVKEKKILVKSSLLLK